LETLSGYSKDNQMRSSNPIIILSLALGCIISAPEVLAQASNSLPRPQSNQERMIQDLLNEVRELRTIVQRIDANSIRTRIILDRLRATQEQLLSLTREIFETRDKIVDVRTRQQKLKEKIPELKKQFEDGLKPGTELDDANAEMEGLTQREQNLLERETQLSTEISAVKASLTDLNNRLDALERESIAPSQNNVKPPVRK
jgi:chromosome segregation ATPase